MDVTVKNTKLRLSVAFIFLCYFVLSNYISPTMYFGLTYRHIPFILSAISIGLHILHSISVKRKPIIQIDWSLVAILIVFLFAYYTTINSFDKDKSNEILFDKFMVAIIFFVMISNIISNVREFKLFLYVLTFGTFFLAYLMVHDPHYSQGRPFIIGSALAKDPNDVTMVLAYSLPFIVALLLSIQNKSKVYSILIIGFLVYVFFLSLLAIVEAKSRGGFLALLVGCLMLFKEIKGMRNKIVFGLVFCMFLVPFTIRYVPKSYIWRMEEITVPSEDTSGSTAARKTNMMIALEYTLTHPISAYGPGNNGYMISHKKGFFEYSKHVFKGSHAHNMFLQIGADIGLIPLLFFISFIFSLFMILRKTKKMIKGDSYEEKQIILFIKTLNISLVVLLVAAFFLPVAYRFYLYYLGGLCMALYRISKSYSNNKPSKVVNETS